MIINPNDNVEIREDGHKYALRDIAEGENVIKYGMPIGHATCAIKKGEHVHVHNVKTNLGEVLEYRYEPDEAAIKGWKTVEPKETFLGYRHPDGRVGIRNDIWVIPLVGCVNRENNTLESFKGRLGLSPEDQDGAKIGLNIRFVKAQDPGDEYEKGLALIKELDAARPKERVPVSVSELVVGLKCGGSDGFSGLTANPLVGRFSDWLAARGGSTVLTEVPEMFGAETLLMKRCRTRSVFDKCVKMINGFKDYYTSHNQVCYENPSPGNKAGGITTLEDKSLGCVQKGGSSPVEDVLLYGESVKAHGLSLMTGPGNDLVASTVLAAAGCHLILFTTGRGTPFGCVVPTMKVATNDALAKKKPNWIDWNAMSNPDVGAFAEKVIAVASGEKAKNEISGAQGIAIFKDGVTL